MKASEAITALVALAANLTSVGTQVDKVIVEEQGLQAKIVDLQNQLSGTDADLPAPLVDAINGVITGAASIGVEVQKLDDLVPDAVATPPVTGDGSATVTP